MQERIAPKFILNFADTVDSRFIKNFRKVVKQNVRNVTLYTYRGTNQIEEKSIIELTLIGLIIYGLILVFIIYIPQLNFLILWQPWFPLVRYLLK